MRTSVAANTIRLERRPDVTGFPCLHAERGLPKYDAAARRWIR
jgi:hypothetical protein